MTLSFRNLDVTPDDSVDLWGVEGIQTALERGSLRNWRRIGAAIQVDPHGKEAREVEEVLLYCRPYGVALAMERLIASARARRHDDERRDVAREVTELNTMSGLSRR